MIMSRFIYISVLVSLFLLSCRSPNTIDPEFIFKNHFETSQEEIRDLIGHGYYFQGGDVWIRLKAESIIYPKDFHTYTLESEENVRTYFLGQFRELIANGNFEEQELSSDINAFMTSEKFSCYQKQVIDNESHREHKYWFVTNEEGFHYFRSWTKG